MVSNMRRICRLRPSLSTTFNQELPSSPRAVVETRSISQGRVRRPSRNTPRRSFTSFASAGMPETFTWYSFGHPVEGA